MFRFFEARVLPTATGMPGQPPGNLLRFYGFFLRGRCAGTTSPCSAPG